MIPYSMTGKLLQTGKVSLDKVKTNMTYGVVLWVFAIIFLAEFILIVYLSNRIEVYLLEMDKHASIVYLDIFNY